jgi:hypothetical protein
LQGRFERANGGAPRQVVGDDDDVVGEQLRILRLAAQHFSKIDRNLFALCRPGDLTQDADVLV